MSLAAGTRVGQYEVAARIGAGGMGEVYRARDRVLARDVAIKTLPAALEHDPDRLTRFRREARALASLNHRNIAAIYGLEEADGVCYLILELADGETLTERLSRTGPLSTEEALRVASQIADALEAAHAKGITHRDIKPSNIKLTQEGRVKVLDFGLAKSHADPDIQDQVSTRSTIPEFLTAPGGVVGTPPYMSPEQIRSQTTDQRSDVWAFGCVVYELLTGLRAFRGSSTPDIFAAILRGEPDWDALPAKVPDEVRGLLQGCLQKEAAERRQNFTEIRRELASAISALPAREHGHKRFTVLVGAAPVALVALLSLIRPTLLLGFEYRVYDTVVRLSPTSPPDSRVMIVDIDDRSLAAIGQWPWRRDVVGKLVARLRSLGADAIVLEFLFAEPDRFEGSVQADGSSSNVATPDTLFAQSLRGGRVVLGNFMSFEPNSASMDECVLHPMDVATHEIEKTHPQKAPFFAATGGVCSLPVLARAAGQSGFLNGTPDPDGILRRAPLLIAFRGRLYPSAALAAVSITKAVEAAELRDRHTSNVSLTLGDLVVPLDGKSNLLLRYRGPQRTFQFISAVDVMEDKTPPQSIQGRIVFVGMSAAGSRDIVATPLDTNFLGVEMQATVADNLLQQDFVYRPLRGPWFEVLAVVASGLILTLLIAYFGLFAGVLAALAALAVFWLGSVWSLSSAGMFLSPFYPSVGVALTLLSWILGKVSVERRRAELAIRNVESAVLDR